MKRMYIRNFFSDFYDIEKNVTEYYTNDVNKNVEENVREHYVNNSVDQDIELSDDLTKEDWDNWKNSTTKDEKCIENLKEYVKNII